MNFKLQHDIDLAQLTTFKIGGSAKYFFEINKTSLLPEIFTWIKEQKLPYIVLSGGSNMVFNDGQFPGIVLKIGLKGFNVQFENSDSATIKIGAGEDWDEVVGKSTSMGLSGIEALSAIPGLTGTAPVQNIGAYGQEIKDVIETVEVFDTKTSKMTSLSKAECEFGYRDSIFKNTAKGRYIITAITLKLSKLPPSIPNYPDVIHYFESKKITNPNLQEIREAIILIRSKKLPDPKLVPNAGSFFKNPIIDQSTLIKLRATFPNIRSFPYNDKYKLSAAWLIEHSGLKGKELGHVRVDPKHALVLENTGGASQDELMKLVKTIQITVKNKFGIQLDPEPVIVKSN